MDYFKVFLEAYSEHHDRSLKLLEQEGVDPRVGVASQVIASKVQGIPPQTQKFEVPNKSPTAPKPTTKVEVYTQGGINVGGKHARWDGQLLSASKNPEAFQSILTMLAGPEGETTSDTQGTTDTTQEVLPPTEEELRAAQLDGTFSKETTKAKVKVDFDHIDLQIQNVWDNLPDYLKRSKYKDSVAEFRTYFIGTRHQSFEKQLQAPKFSLSLVDDIYQTLPYALSDDQLSRISDTFRDLVDIIAKGECDENNEVVRNFAKSQNDDIVVSPKGDPDRSAALAFPTSKATGTFLSDLLSQAADICKSEVVSTRVTAPVTGGGGSSNNIRGVGFETFELIKSLALGRKQGGAVEALVNKKTKELIKQFKKLKDEVEQVWLNEASMTAMDPEEKQELLNLAEILADGPKGRMLLASMSTQSTSRRNPLLSLPVGDQVGKGKRQDILEFYNTKEEAEEAASRSGLEGVIPDEGKFEDFFDSKSQDVKAALLKDKEFKKGQKVFTLKVSLKNYLSLAADHPAKFGGGRYSTFSDLLAVKTDKASRTFVDTINKNLGINKKDFKALKEYSKKLFTMGGVIFKTPQETVTKVGGKKVKVDNAEVIATAILDKFKKAGYKTILGTEADNLLQSAAKIITGTVATPRERKAAYERIQIHLNDRLQAIKIKKDLKSKDMSTRTNAQRFLAYKMFHAGGSDDDNLICDYRGLKDKDSFMFKQNDPLRDAWAAIKNKTKVWNPATKKKEQAWSLDMTDSGQVKLTKNPASDPPMTITMKSSIRSNKIEVWNPETEKKEKKTNGYSSSYIVEVSRGIMEYYSNNDNIQEEIVEMRTLVSKIQSLFEKMTNRRL